MSAVKCSLVALTIALLAARSAIAEDVKPWYVTNVDDEKTALTISIGGQTQTLYSESHALLIGEVNYAPRWPVLKAIPAEIGWLTKALEHQHFKVEAHFDLNSEDMVKVIDRFFRLRGTVSESRLLIYIAGHGYSREISGGRRLGYLLPIDAPKEGSSDPDIAAKALPMTMFSAWSQSPDPRHMLVVFDACFSGAFFGYVGSISDPGVGKIQPTAPAGSGGFAVDTEGQITGPPPVKSGLESTNFAVLDRAERSPGRQFLAAGDSNETVPGQSVLARLLVSILNDKVSTGTTDYWVTGSDIGNWLQRNAPNIARKLYGETLPPSPVYGRLPHDDIYQQGDIVFLRYDQLGHPVVTTPEEEAAWATAISQPIVTDKVLTAVKEESIRKTREEAERQASIAADAEHRYSEVFALAEQEREYTQQNQNRDWRRMFGLGDPAPKYAAMDRRQQLAALKDTAEGAHQREREALTHVETETRALYIEKEDATTLSTSISRAVGAAIPAEEARLSLDEEVQLRAVVDALSSDDTVIRRQARKKLAKWLAGLSGAKQSSSVDLLLTRLSKKSYRFQIGVAEAISEQSKPLTLGDRAHAEAEIMQAEQAVAAKDATLREWLQKAYHVVQGAQSL